MQPLLGEKTKLRGVFGWWPLWQEVIPLEEDGRPDRALIVANLGAGVMIGIRQGLSAIMTASLIFTAAGVPELSDKFAFGITMMWFSSAVSALWYGLFGRMQSGLIGINDVIGILWGTIGGQISQQVDSAQIFPTQLAIIAVSTVLTGMASIIFGQLGLGKLMLLFPAPVTSGFLGSIGFFIFKSSLQISSGVKFHYLWPISFEDFLQPQPLARVGCMFAALAFMRKVPPLLVKAFPYPSVKKLGGLVCQLIPLFAFYLVTSLAGIDMEELTDQGWTYPKQGSSSPSVLWTSRSLSDADWNFVRTTLPSQGLIVMMSVLCTMTGVLGISGKFPRGPPGDPSPDETIDYDRELLTVGWVDLILGLAGGIITFHRLGSTVQLRMDGGTHRIAVFTCSIFCAGLFLSGIPIGHLIPTWFLGGLFMNSSVSLVTDALFSFRQLPKSKWSFLGWKLPSMEYGITIACIVVAIAWSPFAGIFTGLALSVFEFLWHSSQSHPVSGISAGHLSVGRTKRPVWELRVLRREGDRIVLLFLQGQLFFGSADHLSHTLATATDEARLKYCILSFARVIDIDASAARQVKTSVEKAARSGVHVYFCRMTPDVFQELSVAGAIKSPDPALRKVLSDRGINFESWQKAEDTPATFFEASQAESSSGIATFPSRRRMTCEFLPLGTGKFDAFDTESDALDYCNDLLLEEYCYKDVESYKKAYRLACKAGDRLAEGDFEDMHFLPRGTLDRLKPHCEVMNHLPHYQNLPHDCEPTLYFIMRGAISQFEETQNEDVIVARSGKLQTEVKGFTGRGRKRLRARFPPGHVVGKTSFFLTNDGVVDRKVLPMLQVSSRVSGYAEVWGLKRSAWDQLPADLRGLLQDFMLFQLADDRQHALLIE
ncbi:unnamed protein product [Effrenium voratum]|nr:unnamed protein product [Effrenium voratum]